MRDIQAEETKLSKLLLGWLVFILFLTPIFFYRPLATPFSYPQTIILRLGVGLAVIFLLGRWVVNKKILIPKNPILLPASILLLVCVISALRSPHQYTSVFGSYGHWFWGLFSVISYVAILLISSYYPNRYQLFFKTAMASSAIVCFYAIIQHLGLDPWPWVLSAKERPPSTLGNPNYMGAFAAMMFPVSLYFLVTPAQTKKWVKVAMGALTLANFYVCVLSQTRGAWLGLIASCLLWLFLMRSKLKEIKKLMLILLAGAGIALGTAAFITSRYSHSIDVLTRFKVLVSTRERSSRQRLSLWKSSLKIFKDNWFLGVGLDTFGYVFPRYQELKHSRSLSPLQLATNTHNEGLQVAATLGIVGLGAYAWLWLTVIFLFKRLLKQQQDFERRLALCTLAASCLALQTHAFFNFSVAATSAYLWSWFGILGALSDSSTRQWSLPRRWSVPAYALIACLFGIGAYRSVTYLIADYEYKKGQIAEARGKSLEALSHYQASIEREKYYHPAYVGAGNILTRLSKKWRNTNRSALLYNALKILEHAHDLYPRLPETSFNVGMAYFNLTTLAFQPLADKAVEALRKSLETAPYYYHYWTDYGRALALAGRTEEAKGAWIRALEISPQYLPASVPLQYFIPSKALYFYDQEITLTDVPLGEKISISESAKNLFKLVNLENEAYPISVQVLVPSESTLYLRDGYEEPENNEWLSLNKTRLTAAPLAIEKIDGAIEIPKKWRFKNKKFMFVIYAQIADGGVLRGAYGKLYVETRK